MLPSKRRRLKRAIYLVITVSYVAVMLYVNSALIHKPDCKKTTPFFNTCSEY